MYDTADRIDKQEQFSIIFLYHSYVVWPSPPIGPNVKAIQPVSTVVAIGSTANAPH